MENSSKLIRHIYFSIIFLVIFGLFLLYSISSINTIVISLVIPVMAIVLMYAFSRVLVDRNVFSDRVFVELSTILFSCLFFILSGVDDSLRYSIFGFLFVFLLYEYYLYYRSLDFYYSGSMAKIFSIFMFSLGATIIYETGVVDLSYLVVYFSFFLFIIFWVYRNTALTAGSGALISLVELLLFIEIFSVIQLLNITVLYRSFILVVLYYLLDYFISYRLKAMSTEMLQEDSHV